MLISNEQIRYIHGSNQWFAPVGGRTQCYARFRHRRRRRRRRRRARCSVLVDDVRALCSLEAMIADPECCLSIPCPTEEVSNPYLNTYLEVRHVRRCSRLCVCCCISTLSLLLCTVNNQIG